MGAAAAGHYRPARRGREAQGQQAQQLVRLLPKGNPRPREELAAAFRRDRRRREDGRRGGAGGRGRARCRVRRRQGRARPAGEDGPGGLPLRRALPHGGPRLAVARRRLIPINKIKHFDRWILGSSHPALASAVIDDRMLVSKHKICIDL